jgi:hypothetical protein
MPRLVLKIDGEAGENRINSFDFPKPPTPMHAETAGRELHQRLDVVALQFSSRRHFLEFFSHKVS